MVIHQLLIEKFMSPHGVCLNVDFVILFTDCSWLHSWLLATTNTLKVLLGLYWNTNVSYFYMFIMHGRYVSSAHKLSLIRPLDMLSVTKHRVVYTLIFGALADTVFEVIIFSVPISGQTKVVACILSSK